jgi:putative nucleotidyltransferase with HDIG domain
MSVTDPTRVDLYPDAAPGAFGWLASLFRKLFGGGAAARTPVEAAADAVVLDNETGNSYVVAPGGYRIRVRTENDVHDSIGEMIPSVKAGLSLVPPLPHVVMQLLKEIQDPNASAASVGQIASSDPAMAASLIRTVNSAAFGLSRKITSVSEAVNFLGFTSVKAMVLRLQLDQILGVKSKGNEDVEDLWIHSLVVSYVADALARRVPGVDRGLVSTLGLLHDIGKLVVQTQFPNEAKELRGPSGGEAPLARESRVLGVDHAALGANLAAKWKLPGDLVQSIRWHHYPERAFSTTDPKALHQAMHLVQVANQLSKYCYVYQDETEIDAIPDATFDLLGFPHDLTGLLSNEVRSAASRAIFFADDGSARAATAVRRFLRLNRGDSAAALLKSLVDAANGSAQVEVDDVLCDRMFDPATPVVNRLKGPSTPTGVENLSKEFAKAQAAMTLPSDARLPMSLVGRCMLSNAAGQKGDWTELVHVVEGDVARLAIRTPAISFDRRFGLGCDPDVALAALDSELANVLNLGWFDSIATSSDGSTMVFTVKLK